MRKYLGHPWRTKHSGKVQYGELGESIGKILGSSFVYTFVDKGDWDGPSYFENQGIANGSKGRYYLRIDTGVVHPNVG